MKKILVTLLLIVVVTPSFATEALEAIANNILQNIVAMSPRSGLHHEDIFEREFETHLYTAALETADKKIKALLALKAIRDMPMILNAGKKIPTKFEKIQTLNNDTHYVLLREWFFQLSKEK